ncbi:MAG: NosD domain-containing protein, partial [Promethearchaeota archaeon]
MGLLIGYSDHNTIINNTIKGLDYSVNDVFGIVLDHSNNNSIQFNNITRCTFTGINLISSFDNLIYYNFIIGNQKCIFGNLIDNTVLNNSLHWTDLPPISIDEDDPAKNWTFCSKHYDWCSGDVNHGFRIENATINGDGSKNGIEILNSGSQFTIKNCNVYNSGVDKAGIYLYDVSGGDFLDNNLSSNNGYGMYLSHFNMIIIAGNIINNNLNISLLVENSFFSRIENNTVNENTQDGIYLRNGWNINVTENNVNFNSRGIIYNNISSSFLTGNNATHNIHPTGAGISLYLSSNNRVSSNNASYNENDGLRIVTHSNNNEIWQNILYNNKIGIELYDQCHLNEILDNEIVGNGEYGIKMAKCNQNNISDNHLRNNDNGIDLSDGDANNFTNNEVKLNNENGIKIDGSNSNNLIGNNLIQNGKGLSIEGDSDSNLIYNNTFVGNTLNAEDNSYKLIPTIYHRNYADQVLDFRGLLWGTAFPRVVGDSSLIAPALSTKDNWNLFLEADNQYYSLWDGLQWFPAPNWVNIRWGNYDNIVSGTHQFLTRIRINYRIMAEGGWKPYNYLDQAGPLILRVYDDVGNSQQIGLVDLPGDQIYYDTSYNRAPWDITSGPVFDRVKQGGYIKSCEALMWVYEPASVISPIFPYYTLTIVWVNIDFLDIAYYTSVVTESNNQWDNGTSGNYYDDLVGVNDEDDNGIADNATYIISGTAGSVDHYPLYWDKYELFMEIINWTDEWYMGDDINFTIALEDYFNNSVNLLVDALEQKAYWDAHRGVRTHFSSFTNFSGSIFDNETGTPSYIEDWEIYFLNFTMYPYNSLMVAPEILEYDPITQYSRQRIEIYFQLDFDWLFNVYNLELKDISYINATLFGAPFLENDFISNIIDTFGKIEVFNYLTNSYFTLSDGIYNETFKLGNANNPLTLANLPDYSFDFTANNLSSYVDSNNIMEFRFISYFEGNLSNAQDSYLSNFKTNSVLGTWLDFISFDVIWWEETPEKIPYLKSTEFYSNSTYTYNPTCPGTYTIQFETRNNTIFKTAYGQYTIEVKRRPVDIIIDVTSKAYSTDYITISADVTDIRTGAPAVNARVIFYYIYQGNYYVLGEDFTDIDGRASFSVTNLFQGDYQIFADVVENHGRFSKPFLDEPFEYDIWAYN